ncbi:MAG: metallophosphoesterase [Candidatus Thermoplasmatota archaeon]|nr:metallophosphoesterase [Candidatus Thermoplasmatota archaeon]
MRGYRLDADVELLPGGAIMLRRSRTIVVADLHLGCEAALEHEGVSLPRVQAKKIEAYLMSVIEAVGPDELVVAGDLKHNFSRNLTQEWDEVTSFVRSIADLVDIVVVRGNHDNFLSTILTELNIPLKREYEVGDHTVLHGHTGTSKKGPLVLGHIHPSILLRDDVGAGMKSPCFLYDRARRVLVLPALSIVSPGMDVVGNPSSDVVSPLIAPYGLGEFVPIVFSSSKPMTFPTVVELRRWACKRGAT